MFAVGFKVAQSRVASAPVSPTMRRITRPGGRLMKTLGTSLDTLVARIDEQQVAAAPPLAAPPGLTAQDRPPLNVAGTTTSVVTGLAADTTVTENIFAAVNLPARLAPKDGELTEVMAYPKFDLPMYADLLKMSTDTFVPNLGLLPPNSISLLENNRRFIESYLVGLNYEMAREMLWREYPTDQRGTPFRQFWDPRAAPALANETAAARRERLYDIPPIHEWGTAALLGENPNPKPKPGDPPRTNDLVLVIRGELLRKYPTAAVYAHKADWPDKPGQPGVPDKTGERTLAKLPAGVDPPRSLVRLPIYEAKAEPDIYLLGFDLDADTARGKGGDLGWFFVLKERPGDPRFGLDEDQPGPPTPVEVWNDLSWGRVDPTGHGFIRFDGNVTVALDPFNGDEDDQEKTEQRADDVQVSAWQPDVSAADAAYILFQAPVLVAIHAQEMLPDAPLSLDFPVLLGPVRVETSFTATELLVRVFPDEWSVTKLEPLPTPAELAALDAYWVALWASGGSPVREQAAWHELVARIPAGRAAWLLRGRQPSNPNDRPLGVPAGTAVLVVVSPQAVAANDRPPTIAYWTAVWQAHGDRVRLRNAEIALVAAVGQNQTRATAIKALRPSGVDAAPATPGDNVTIAFLVLPTRDAGQIAAQSWTVAATATLLPDRFTVFGYVGGTLVFSQTGGLVRQGLAVSPDPKEPTATQLKIDETAGTLSVPPALRWLTDFTEAVAAGMGLRIPLQDSFRNGVDRLVVLGLREQATPAQTATALGGLLSDQLHSPAGLSLLPQGTPTNNSEDQDAGQDPTAEADAAQSAAARSAAAGFAAAAVDWTTKTDGQWFAELLGLDPAVLAGVPNSDGTDRRDARAAQTALWPATSGYFLPALLNGGLTADQIEQTRQFFVANVSGRGPLPAVKIGRQPYGILPTTVFSRLAFPAAATHRTALNAVLKQLAQRWHDALAHVADLDAPSADPHQTLLDILALHPTSAEYHLLADAAHPLATPVVDDRPLSETDLVRPYTTDGRDYLTWLAESDLSTIGGQQGFTDDVPPATLLYLLARQAVLAASTGTVPAELVQALTFLAGLSTAKLERVFAEHVDCATYRLDAWRLGLVNERLAEMRYGPDGTGQPVPGLHLGAYGLLEQVTRNTDPVDMVTVPTDLTAVFGTGQIPHDRNNAGYVHTPSPAHARTAAVLRAGYLANADPAKANVFEVNLSSERVRLAMTIADGMRQGQALGALLGYRFERGLHDRDAGLDTFIAGLRLKFPLRANKIDDTALAPDDPAAPTSIEQVEAGNVIDGLALLRHVNALRDGGSPDDYPFGFTDLTPASPTQIGHIRAEVNSLRNTLDAVADVAVAEGAHQALQGNAERASAALDAYAKEGLPPAPSVVETPRSGTTLTHRLGLQLTPGLDPDHGAPLFGHNKPRAQAEPAVNDWLPEVLPKPETVAALVTWHDEDGHAHDHTVSQADAGLSPIDLLWALRPTDQAAMTDLDDRIIGVVVDQVKPRPDFELHIEYTTQIDGMVTFFEVSPLVAAVRTLLTTARPLRQSDLVPAAGPADVNRAADDAVTLPKNRPTAVLASLTSLISDVAKFVADLGPLYPDGAPPNRTAVLNGIDTFPTRYAKLAVTAGGFGLLRSGWGELAQWRRGVFADVLAAVAVLAARMAAALAAANALLDQYEHLPNSTPNEPRFQLLEKAERLLTTRPKPRDDTPAHMRTRVRNLRNTFTNNVNALQQLAGTNRTALSDLLKDVAAILPPAEFDPQGLDLTPFRDRVVVFGADLLARGRKLADELAARRDAATTALQLYDQAVPGPDQVRAGTDALKALLGEDVLSVPEFTPPAAVIDQWRKARNDSDKLVAHLKPARDFPVDDWLHGMARVREAPRLWEQTVLLADALLGPGGLLGVSILDWTEPQLSPIQLPFVQGDHWLGMEFAKDPKLPDQLGQDRLLFTAHYATGLSGNRQCGLLLDEWTEVIPAERETTGVAVHHNGPDSEPPQSMLLVVPPVRVTGGQWAAADLVDAITETFEMAKTRAVEPAHLGAATDRRTDR